MKDDTPKGYYRNPVTGELKRIPPPSPFDIRARVYFDQELAPTRQVVNPITGKVVTYY